MKKMEVSQLIHDALAQLREFQLKPSTLVAYEKRIFSPIRLFFDEREQGLYCTDISADYLAVVERLCECGQISVKTKRLREKGILILDELYLTGALAWRMRPKERAAIPECYVEVFMVFQRWLSDNCQRNRSITSIVRKYLTHLASNGVSEVGSIHVNNIQQFIIDVSPEHRGSMDYVSLALRHFHDYLSEHNLLKINHDLVLTTPRERERRVLPCIDQNEIRHILEQIDLSSAMGKRDYAILVLDIYTGLRAGDIARLKLTDIDWINNEIHIVQGKTNTALVLPLTPLVGNAIADYLIHSRPFSDSPNVFLRVLAPFQGFQDGVSIACIFRRYLKKAGIDHESGDGRTFHGLRRTLGTALVLSGIPVTTVAQILGHRTIKTTKQYISLDISGLRQCALDFSSIGGARYE